MINVEKELDRIRRERLKAIQRQNSETRDSDGFPRDYTLLWVSVISGLFGFFAGMVVMAMIGAMMLG
jgi:hypothetical protein